MPSKKSTRAAAERSGSPAPDVEIDEVEEPNPDNALLSKKGGKKKKASDSGSAKAPKKQKKQKEPEPVEEDDDEGEEGEEEVVDEMDEEQLAAEKAKQQEGMDEARVAVKAFRGVNRRYPTGAEFADEVEFECTEGQGEAYVKAVKSINDAETNSKRRARFTGLVRLAKKSGMNSVEGSSVALAKGTDSIHPNVSMSDALRLATWVPYTPAYPSFDEEEFNARLELKDASLPVSAARIIQANVDSAHKNLMFEAVALAMQQRGCTKVRAVHMQHVLKKYADNMAFTSMYAAPGLVHWGKSKQKDGNGKAVAGTPFIAPIAEGNSDGTAKKKRVSTANKNLESHKGKVAEIDAVKAAKSKPVAAA